MATPDFIKFSRLRGTPTEVYQRLATEFLEPMHTERHQFAYLCESDDPFYGKLTTDGEPIPCESIEQLIDFTKSATLFGSMHLFPYVPAYIYFHVTDVDETGLTFTSSIDTSLVSWDFRHWDRGHPDRWFKVMLTMLTSALQAEVCGWGRDLHYQLEYESLSPDDMVARLRSGEILQTRKFPVFHAISVDLITELEVRRLIRNHEAFSKPRGMQYEVTLSGYHLFYILP